MCDARLRGEMLVFIFMQIYALIVIIIEKVSAKRHTLPKCVSAWENSACKVCAANCFAVFDQCVCVLFSFVSIHRFGACKRGVCFNVCVTV